MVPDQPISAIPAETPDQQAAPALPWRSLAVLAATVALTLALVFFPPDFSGLGGYGYLGAFLVALLASATVLLPSPALGVGLVAGRTLDPWLSGLLMGLGASFGEVTGYLAGRAGSDLAVRSRFYAPIARQVERWDMLAIFVLAAIPLPLIDLAGIAAGTLRMPYWRFQLACSAGKVVRFVLVANLGRYLAQQGVI